MAPRQSLDEIAYFLTQRIEGLRLSAHALKAGDTHPTGNKDIVTEATMLWDKSVSLDLFVDEFRRALAEHVGYEGRVRDGDELGDALCDCLNRNVEATKMSASDFAGDRRTAVELGVGRAAA